MTNEEAAVWFEKILAGAKQGLEERPEEGKRVYGMCKELTEIALSALRPVSRERVERMTEPCEFCGEWIGGECTPKEQDAGYKIYAGYIKQVAVDDFWEDEIENLNFCPVCGRPMTDEAVQMVMERLEEL